MVKIAIVDSGLTTEYRERYLSLDRVSGCSFIETDDGIYRIDDQYEDLLGHGTACVCLIDKRVSSVEYYIVNIFNEDGKSSSELLLLALRHLQKIDVNIICVSLATKSEKNINDLQTECDKLFSQNKIIVASCSNVGGNGFPAVFPNVYGVDRTKISKMDSYYFYPDEEIQIVCDGYPEEVFCSPLQHLGGSSKAAAVFCSIISKQVEDLPYGADIRDSILMNAEKSDRAYESIQDSRIREQNMQQ